MTEENVKLEKEKSKELRSSIEMTTEMKRLVLMQKEWMQERKELVAANVELAAELERLQQKREEACLQEMKEVRKEVDMQQELDQLRKRAKEKTSSCIEVLKELRESLREKTSVGPDFEMNLDAKEQSVETLILVLKQG